MFARLFVPSQHPSVASHSFRQSRLRFLRHYFLSCCCCCCKLFAPFRFGSRMQLQHFLRSHSLVPFALVHASGSFELMLHNHHRVTSDAVSLVGSSSSSSRTSKKDADRSNKTVKRCSDEPFAGSRSGGPELWRRKAARCKLVAKSPRNAKYNAKLLAVILTLLVVCVEDKAR